MRASLIVAAACALALVGSGVEGRSLRSLRQWHHAAAVAAVAPALHASQCGFAGLDFSSLQGNDIEGSDGGSRYAFYLGVCGPVSSQAAATCLQVQQETSACQLQVEGGMQTFDLGNWDASALPVWSYINASDPQVGVQYTMTGANQCWAQGGDAQPYQTTVQLVCAKEQGPLKVITSLMSCLFTYQLPTPLACGASPPGPSPPGACGFDGRDLSSLTGSDLVGSDGSSRYAYYLRVCGSVQSAAASSCASVDSHTGACQVQTQGGLQTFDLGNWDAQQPPVWELIDAKAPEKGVQYTMQGAPQCWSMGTAESYVTTVQFVCAASAKPLVVQTPLQPKPCGFTFVIETPLACPPPRQQPRHIVLTEQ